MEKIITAKDIASALNMSVGSVYMCLCKNPGKMSAKTVARVREYAESVGYNPVAASRYGLAIRGECVGSRAKYIKESPFGSYQGFVAHCEKLRKDGWLNAEIAKMCGCSLTMVYCAIGKQPAEYTAYSMAKAGEDRAMKNAARRERAEKLRKAEERKRLQETLESLQKDKEETLTKMNDMQNRFRIAYAQKYDTYKGLVDMIEATERQIEEVA